MFDDEFVSWFGTQFGKLSLETMQQQHIFSWSWIDDIRKLKSGITPKKKTVEFEYIGRFTPGKNKALPSSAADSCSSESPLAVPVRRLIS